MVLAPAHLEELARSAVTAEVAERAGLYSESDLRVLAKMTRTPKTAWSPEHAPALVFPYHLPGGGAEPAVWRVKPAVPMLLGREGEKTERKYLHPYEGANHLYFPPSLLENAERRRSAEVGLLVTEGEKKTLAAEAAGLACIGLSGVSAWSKKRVGGRGPRVLHEDWEHVELRGRHVAIVFDSDAATTFDVRREEEALATQLQKAGALVRVVRLPHGESGAKQGLDDFLVASGAAALRELVNGTRVLEAPKEEERPAWDALLTRDQRDRVQRTAHNAFIYLAHAEAWDGVLAFDERAGVVLVEREPPFHAEYRSEAPCPREYADADLSRTQMWLEREAGLVVPKDIVLDAVLTFARRRTVEPVRDYLEGLTWDGVPRCDQWLAMLLGADDTEYTRAVGARWLLSAVARAYEPGCKADHVLVLEGEQGKGKSSALEVLAGGPRHFTDEIPNLGSKDSAIQLQGMWIVELAELDALRRSEVTSVKAFISRKDDRFRAPWAKVAEAHPRRCVFAGTTNGDDYLRDDTGNRRFWPVRVRDVRLEELRAVRDQLWAEAVARYRAGEHWYLDNDELLEAAREEQAERHQVDPWEQPVRDWLFAAAQRARGRVTTFEVLSECLKLDNARIGRAEETRAGAVLRGLGCTTERMSREDARELGITYRGRFYVIPGPRLVRTNPGPTRTNLHDGVGLAHESSADSTGYKVGMGVDQPGQPTRVYTHAHTGAGAGAGAPAGGPAQALARARGSVGPVGPPLKEVGPGLARADFGPNPVGPGLARADFGPNPGDPGNGRRF